MPSSLNGTGIAFSDNTVLNSANDVGGNYKMVTFAASGTWTKPAGLKAVRVTVIGGGGRGAGTTPSGSGNIVSGGGAGGAAVKYFAASALASSVVVTVGLGGGQGAADGELRPGLPGGTSSFGSLVSATGGSNGGIGGFIFTPPPVQEAVGGAGGVGSDGDVNTQGARGGSALRLYGVNSFNEPVSLQVIGRGAPATLNAGWGSDGSNSGYAAAPGNGVVLVEELF
jgi:hypothetical protein